MQLTLSSDHKAYRTQCQEIVMKSFHLSQDIIRKSGRRVHRPGRETDLKK